MPDNPFGLPINFGPFGLHDPLASKWSNKPVDPPTTPTTPSSDSDDARWLRDGQQLVVARDGMTGTISFLQAVNPNGDLVTDRTAIPKVNSRWSDNPSSPTYNLLCVSVKGTPYAITKNGSERLLYTCEYSSQPLDPTEIDFGGDFVSIKPAADGSGFKWWDDDAPVTQTVHRATLSVKFRITKRRSSLPYDDIVDRLGCVNTDDFQVPDNQGGIACTIPGTQDNNDPDSAFLLFEGCKAVETTDPVGGVMWKIVYNFNAKYNMDSDHNKYGWNNIYRDSTNSFELIYTGEVASPHLLYHPTDLSMLIADEKET